MKQCAELTVAPRELLASSSLKQDIYDAIARRAYELFASRGFSHGHDWADWFLAESEFLQQVPLEVSETQKELTITAALPGFTEKDIEVRVEPRRLFISGQQEKRSEKKKGEVVYSERRSDQVYRAIDLPAEIDPDKIKATLNNGELEITLPKKEVGKKLMIEEKAARLNSGRFDMLTTSAEKSRLDCSRPRLEEGRRNRFSEEKFRWRSSHVAFLVDAEQM